MPKKKEVEQREADLIAVLDAKNLADLRERQPEVEKKIRALVAIGHSAVRIGQVIRNSNPQMWVESKFAESVARAIWAEEQ
jgi:hypothetical protein